MIAANGSSGHARLTVVVTGLGAPLGISIFKALRQSRLRPRIVGIDAEPMSVGLFRSDSAHIVPWASRDPEGYLDRLVGVCEQEAVDLVCFGSEIEMEVASSRLEELKHATGAELVVNRGATLRTFLDKWDSVEALRDRGLPVPESALAHDRDAVEALLGRHGFPVVVKPRRGGGSKGVLEVRSRRELDLVTELRPDAVVQEYLEPASEEYTVGGYRSLRQGYLGQIIMRRELAAGLTYKAEVVNDDAIARLARSVFETFDIWGPTNLQLRKTAAGPRIFEVNPRFSSTTVMRAHFGFNEAELCLRDVVLGEHLSPPVVRLGYALRYWDEVYVDSGSVASQPGVGTGLAASREDDF